MIVHKYGKVIIGSGPIYVEGWNVEREPSDPAGASDNQLLLAFAVKWAQQRLQEAINQSLLAAFNEAKKKKESESPAEQQV